MWQAAVMLFDPNQFQNYFQDALAMALIDGTDIQEKFLRGMSETLVKWIEINAEDRTYA